MKGKHQDTKALSDVLAEMQRQDAKWEQTEPPRVSWRVFYL